MRLRTQRGQILFEFVLILPLMLLLLFALIDAGWYFYNRIAVMNASISGADFAVGGRVTDPEVIRWRVYQAAGAVGLDPKNIEVRVLYREGHPVLAAVGIKHRYRPIVSGVFFKRPVMIRAQSIRYYPIPDLGS